MRRFIHALSITAGLGDYYISLKMVDSKRVLSGEKPFSPDGRAKKVFCPAKSLFGRMETLHDVIARSKDTPRTDIDVILVMKSCKQTDVLRFFHRDFFRVPEG